MTFLPHALQVCRLPVRAPVSTGKRQARWWVYARSLISCGQSCRLRTICTSSLDCMVCPSSCCEPGSAQWLSKSRSMVMHSAGAPYAIHRTLYTTHHTLYTTHHTPYTTHYTPHTIHHTPHTAHHTPHTTHHTPHTAHHTPHTTHLHAFMRSPFILQAGKQPKRGYAPAAVDRHIRGGWTSGALPRRAYDQS
jgi:hypothetical protein